MLGAPIIGHTSLRRDLIIPGVYGDTFAPVNNSMNRFGDDCKRSYGVYDDSTSILGSQTRFEAHPPLRTKDRVESVVSVFIARDLVRVCLCVRLFLHLSVCLWVTRRVYSLAGETDDRLNELYTAVDLLLAAVSDNGSRLYRTYVR